MKPLSKYVVWCDACGYRVVTDGIQAIRVGLSHKLGQHGVRL